MKGKNEPYLEYFTLLLVCDAFVLDAGNLGILKLALPLRADEFAFRAFGVRKPRSTSLYANVEKKRFINVKMRGNKGDQFGLTSLCL